MYFLLSEFFGILASVAFPIRESLIKSVARLKRDK